MYINQSIQELRLGHDYGDTPEPKIFGNVSPLDPQLFLRINDFVDELIKGQSSGKYTPIEVAQWIEDYADAAAKNLNELERKASNKSSPEFRRLVVDIKAQIGLGRFFGAKFRAAVLYGISEQSGDANALAEATKAYRRARAAWADIANATRDVYQTDVTIGELPQLRGHWTDRLTAIDRDISVMEEKVVRESGKKDPQPHIKALIQEVASRPHRPAPAARHVQPATFHPGQPLELELNLTKSSHAARLYYRHVNQGERFETLDMQPKGSRFQAAIPADYTNSSYPLQYYFVIQRDAKNAALYPGFEQGLTHQPYFVVSQV